MNFFRRHSGYRTLLVVTTLLGLLLQVQTAFACQMMDAAGPAKACCCGDKATHPNPEPDHEPDQSPCCDFSLELSFKNIHDGSSPPLLISTQPDHSPPVYAIPSYTLAWSEPGTLRAPAWRRDFAPARSGTHTYLATLRLRI